MDDTKTRILKAASELFLEGGVSALSVRAISRKAGLSTIGIYSHFDGKQGILDTLYIQGFEQVERAMTLPDGTYSLDERVSLLTRNYLRNALENEGHYRLIFGDQITDYEPSDTAMICREKAMAALIAQVGQMLPGLTPDQTRLEALSIWAYAHGFVSLRHHVFPVNQETESWMQMVTSAMLTLARALTEQHKGPVIGSGPSIS